MSIAMIVAGCPKNTGLVEAPEKVPIEYEGFECPAGTVAVGGAPPVGTQIWCNLTLPNGSQVRHGPTFMWHANGTLSAQGHYAEDTRDGAWRFFSSRGTPEREGSYLYGKEDGVWTFYHPGGEKASSGRMVGGGNHGEWTYWDVDGHESKGTWIQGQKEGVWVEHNSEGTPIRERTYREGRLIEQKELREGR